MKLYVGMKFLHRYQFSLRYASLKITEVGETFFEYTWYSLLSNNWHTGKRYIFEIPDLLKSGQWKRHHDIEKQFNKWLMS